VPLIRQRRRLGETLAELDQAQWASPSRCEAWSVQDVVTPLLSTNQFWAASIASGVAGTPTRFLATFDPVKTPAALVDGMRTLSPADVLAQYVETVDALAAAVGDVSDDAWSRPAEAPPGHIELRGVALHALWDAWIHERDIGVPLGLTQPAEEDEIQASLVYAAAIGPALVAAAGSTRRGKLGVAAHDPQSSFVVEAGPTVTVRPRHDEEVADVELRGDAVDLIEGLTFRAPLEQAVPPAHSWLLGGLAEVFDLTP
jgi:uncharacterized protein (TIGR03083 family)